MAFLNLALILQGGRDYFVRGRNKFIRAGGGLSYPRFNTTDSGAGMAIYLTEAEVESLVDVNDAIGALEGAFAETGAAGAANLPRQRLPLPERSVNMMAASLPSAGVFGTKVYFAGFYIFTLYSFAEKRILAIIEAGALGAIRTGAASGLATRLLAREDSCTCGLIGAGKQGRTQLLAVHAVRPLERAMVYNRTRDSREDFAAGMADEIGIEVIAADSAEACVRDADIVITATRAAEPVVLGDWLAPGTHINAVGANAYARRELDEAAVLRADVRATDDRAQAKIEAREFIDLAAAGRIEWEDIGELGAMIQGHGPARSGADQITLFKSLGIALEDVAFAKLIYDRAVANGIGRTLEGFK